MFVQSQAFWPTTHYKPWYSIHTLRWRHNDHAGVSNHQPHGCLLNRLFRRKSKKTSKLRVTGLCAGNSPGTGEFPAQMASYAENVSIWWRHHVLWKCMRPINGIMCYWYSIETPWRCMHWVNKLSSYWYSIESLWKCMCLINKIIKLYQQCLHYLNNKQWINSLNICETRTTRTPAFWGYPPPPHDYPHYWIPSQKNNRSRTENATERTRFSKSRSNDLEDIGQGQRSSHATHLLMLVIICTKYGKNPSRTVDATERTRFSRSRPNDLEYIGQGQRSSHATHLLMLVIICTKYGKNPSRTVDATERTRFSRSRPNDLEDIGQGQRSSHATHLLMLVIICTKYGKNPSRTVDATKRTRFSRSRPNDLEDICQGQRSLYATHPLMLVIICAKYGKNPSRIVDFFFQGQGQKV